MFSFKKLLAIIKLLRTRNYRLKEEIIDREKLRLSNSFYDNIEKQSCDEFSLCYKHY